MAVKNFSDKNIPAAWQDYLLLTEQTAKFIELQDMDMVNELLAQRDQMQLVITAGDYAEFQRSEEGKRFFQFLEQVNKEMTMRLRCLLNNARRQQEVSDSYAGADASITGTREWNT